MKWKLVAMQLLCAFFAMASLSFPASAQQLAQVEKPEVAGSTSAQVLDTEKNSDFAQCAVKFFGPSYPDNLKASGLKFDMHAAFAWFIINVPSLTNWPPGSYEYAMKENRKFFDDNGWKDYTKFVDQLQLQKLFSDNNNRAAVVSYLGDFPKFNYDSRDDIRSVFFFANVRSSFVIQSQGKSSAQQQDKLLHLVVKAVRAGSDGTLLIDQWQLKEPIEDLKN